ncbi:MAG: hypothetical protein HZA36_03750 [Parcubacteria group bacterium]|nr:hypothetical protein [Parcubacteria group bacterium]
MKPCSVQSALKKRARLIKDLRGLVLRDKYEQALNDINDALDDLVEKGKCRMSGDYDQWHFNE